MVDIHLVKESNIAVEALGMIKDLLIELGDESEDAGNIDRFISNKDRLLIQPGHYIYTANYQGELIGVMTVSENFALFAGGSYGTINEMYVKPQHRSKNTGKLLINQAKKLAAEKKWTRLDVTSPIEERWMRTVNFYENQGFNFTGEKLKINLRETSY